MSRMYAVVGLLAATVTGCAITDTPPEDNTPPPWTNGVSTLSGAGSPGYVDGIRGTARFHNPVNVAVGPDGVIYVADFDNDKLRAVTADGTASTILSQKGFARPFGLLFVGNTLYVGTDNDKDGKHGTLSGSIWAVDVHAHTAAIVASGIGRTRGLVALKDGRLAFSDYEHQVIQTVDLRSGVVTPLAGTRDVKGDVDGVGGAAKFAQPYGMVLRPDGSLLVADWENSKLRVVKLDGTVTTFAGGQGFADGAMGGAKFFHPQGMATAANGDIYITDIDNFRVRRIKADGSAIETIAGDGMDGYIDADDKLASEFNGLEGLSVAPDGSMVYVADGTRGTDALANRIRQIKM